jgi:hypothetical protein
MMDARRRRARPLALAALLAVPLLAAGPARAVPCALDEPPAATLLLPYFEVDLAGSATTLLSIGSATREGTLARVTLWSDLGVPVLWFDVYLTGWDVQTINLRDVLAGSLPRTATPFADPGDHISPQGDLSSETDYPGCAELMPPPPLGPDLAAHVRTALTGRESPLDPGTCSGWHHGDETARGWATVDVVERCATAPPGVEGLGNSGGLGSANVLWGDFLLVDPVENRASGANLVRLEAAPELFGEDDRTFYSSKAGDGLDAREPLPTAWATRYLAGGIPGDVATELIYWRDPREPSQPFACEGSARSFDDVVPWFPLTDGVGWVVFDEQENPDIFRECGVATCPPPHPLDDAHFPFHAGRLRVGGPDLPVPFHFGWLYLDLGRDEAAAPSWIGTLMQAEGRFSAAIEATPLDDPCSPGRTPPGSE